jgi:glycosyltransferase involved in cell wall biosynthesis
MTIGLALLVKNEEAGIGRAIEQALPVVDHVTILDTGSTDNTIDVAKATLYETGVDFLIERRPFDGFGPSRTALLEFARQAPTEHTLMLDADHTLHIEGDRPELDADEYMIRVRDDGGRLPLLTRTQHPFRYEGVAHSYLVADKPPTVAHTDWLSIDGGPGASREKIECDRVLLEQEHRKHPRDARTVFYLAQTYRDLDMVDAAIQMYRKRAQMGGWPEEVYWARYQAGCLLSQHKSFQQGAHMLLAAWESRPSRVEALRALANAANAVAAKTTVPDDVLFVQPAAYAATT